MYNFTDQKPAPRADDARLIRTPAATATGVTFLQSLQVMATPDAFDERQSSAAYGCASHEILEQGACGSSWAFAATRTYSDRLCRASSGQFNGALSEQDLISCYKSGPYYVVPRGNRITGPASFSTTWLEEDGCFGGGSVVNAFVQLTMEARASRWARPYIGEGFTTSPCAAFSNPLSINYSAAGGQVYVLRNAAGFDIVGEIKTAVYTQGPVATTVEMWRDLSIYTGGVYVKDQGQDAGSDNLGLHAVVIIGWGVTPAGLPYWICANRARARFVSLSLAQRSPMLCGWAALEGWPGTRTPAPIRPQCGQ
jgi:cathepsin B